MPSYDPRKPRCEAGMHMVISTPCACEGKHLGSATASEKAIPHTGNTSNVLGGGGGGGYFNAMS